MRVSLSGLLRNAAAQIDELSAHIRGHTDELDPDSDEPDPAPGQSDYYAYCLRETAKHARETRAGEHTVAEFAYFYGLADTEAVVLTEADACPL